MGAFFLLIVQIIELAPGKKFDVQRLFSFGLIWECVEEYISFVLWTISTNRGLPIHLLKI